jgi:hypothetical protein
MNERTATVAPKSAAQARIMRAFVIYASLEHENACQRFARCKRRCGSALAAMRSSRKPTTSQSAISSCIGQTCRESPLGFYLKRDASLNAASAQLAVPIERNTIQPGRLGTVVARSENRNSFMDRTLLACCSNVGSKCESSSRGAGQYKCHQETVETLHYNLLLSNVVCDFHSKTVVLNDSFLAYPHLSLGWIQLRTYTFSGSNAH